MHFFKSIAIASAISAGLLAQNSPAPPVQAKRLPPEKPKGKPSGANDNLIDRYDFGAQINALQDTNSLQRGAQTVNPSLASTPASPASWRVRSSGRVQAEDRRAAHENGAGGRPDERKVDVRT